MGINIGCGAEIAMSQPFLDMLHRNTAVEQKTGTTMAQVMESDAPKPFFAEFYGKLACDVIGPDQIPQSTNAKILEKTRAFRKEHQLKIV